MLDPSQIEEARGSYAYDCDGWKLGTVVDLYSRDRSCVPAWATVQTGEFGPNASFVPLAGATYAHGRLTLAYTRRQVAGAPRVGSAVLLTASQERRLYAYYGLDTGVVGGESADGTTGSFDRAESSR